MSYLTFFLKQGLVFIITPAIIGLLGSVGYGVWAVLGSVMNYVGMLNVGIGSATTRYAAKYHATDDKNSINRLVSTLLAAVVVIGILTMLVCMGLMPFIPSILNIPADLVSAAQITFLVMGFNLVLVLPGGVAARLVYGFQRLDALKAFMIVQLVSNAVLTVILLNLGVGLAGLAIAASVSIAINLALNILFIHRQKYGIHIQPRFVKLEVIKEIAPYSIRTFVLSLTDRLLYNSANIVISISLGITHVTPYSIAYKLCYITNYLFTVVVESVYPRFTKLYTLKDFESLRLLYLKVARLCMIIVVPIMLTLWICGRPFIYLWVGEENFLGMGAFVLLIIYSIPHAVVGCAFSLLQAIGKNKGLMLSEIINAVLNVSISIVLVRMVGLLGMAIGTLTASLLSSFWAIPYLAAKHIQLSFKRYLFSALLPPLLVGLPAALIAWLLVGNFIPNTHIAFIALKALLIFGSYIGLYLLFGATKEERRMYLRLLPRVAGINKSQAR